jgi:hypothetical protein
MESLSKKITLLYQSWLILQYQRVFIYSFDSPRVPSRNGNNSRYTKLMAQTTSVLIISRCVERILLSSELTLLEFSSNLSSGSLTVLTEVLLLIS